MFIAKSYRGLLQNQKHGAVSSRNSVRWYIGLVSIKGLLGHKAVEQKHFLRASQISYVHTCTLKPYYMHYLYLYAIPHPLRH
jgi:hypothetical protein